MYTVTFNILIVKAKTRFDNYFIAVYSYDINTRYKEKALLFGAYVCVCVLVCLNECLVVKI